MGLATLVAGCTLVTQSPPQVDVANVALTGIGLFNQRLLVTLCVTNPNRSPLAFERVTFKIAVADAPLADGVTQSAVAVPALASVLVPVAVETTIRDFARSVRVDLADRFHRLPLERRRAVNKPALWITVQPRGATHPASGREKAMGTGPQGRAVNQLGLSWNPSNDDDQAFDILSCRATRPQSGSERPRLSRNRLGKPSACLRRRVYRNAPPGARRNRCGKPPPSCPRRQRDPPMTP